MTSRVYTHSSLFEFSFMDCVNESETQLDLAVSMTGGLVYSRMETPPSASSLTYYRWLKTHSLNGQSTRPRHVCIL
jgi:hypothetical protein